MKVTSVFILLILFSNVVMADQYDKPMEFYEGWDGGNALEATWIAAIGKIEKDTPEKFKQFLEEKKPETTKIVFHSPGGNLIAGIELGREIRKIGIDTFVAKSIKNPAPLPLVSDNTYSDFSAGKCLSACAYAFLGGTDRAVITDKSMWGSFYHNMLGSKIGFHKFSNDVKIKKAVSADQANFLVKFSLSKAQFVSGFIVSYLIEMGVDANFIYLISKNETDDIIYFSEKVLKKYKIITDKGYSKWTMMPLHDGILTYSLNNASSYAYNFVEKVGFFCSRLENKPTILMDSFKSQKIQDIQNSKVYDRDVYLTLDGKEILIKGINVRMLDMQSVYITITNEIARKIYLSDKLSISLVVPRSEGGYYTPDIFVNETEKKMIKLSLLKCIKE